MKFNLFGSKNKTEWPDKKLLYFVFNLFMFIYSGWYYFFISFAYGM